LDKKFVFYYPFPHFFYTNKKNKKAVERIRVGLEIAWQDGSFNKLWQEYYQNNINQAKLDGRILYELFNSEMKHLPVNIDQYMYPIIQTSSID
jgi:hypothetical protein